jgi:hypothetical protein
MDHIIAAITLDHIVATMTLDHIVATTALLFDNIVVFVIPLVAIMTSSPVMRHKEHLWNFCVLQKVRFSNLVCSWFI